jgi:subtilisin
MRATFVKKALSVGAVAALVASFVTPLGAAAPEDKIPGSYIVVLKDGVDADAASDELAAEHGLALGHVYRSALRGFSAHVPEARLARLAADSRVAFVSEDRVVEANVKPGAAAPAPTQPAEILPTGIRRALADANANEGAGQTVAVIDTGIDLTHPDLKANIVANKSCIIGKKNGNDDNGHGTHVAGTIAALDNAIGAVGVASQAKLVAVKVLNAQGSGSWSSIICGLDWVTANAAALNITVANMSLGGGGSSDNNCGNTNNDALHKAVCRTRDAGVTIVVAAGNEATDAATKVPASYDDAVITVSALADSDGLAGGLGATTGYGADDTFASFSNYGNEVDLGAPGVKIFSTWKGGAYNTISGTSMASPHVAGAAALYLASHPGASWTTVRDALAAGGEVLGAGHTDPSGLHPENVLRADTL